MKAAHVAIESMKGHLDAVYDITVAYEGTVDASGQRRSAPSMPGMHPPVWPLILESMPVNSFSLFALMLRGCTMKSDRMLLLLKIQARHLEGKLKILSCR